METKIAELINFAEKLLLASIALLAIVATGQEIIVIVENRNVDLADLLLLFIYTEVLGMIGIAHFWQMAYGTFLYFFQYCYHRRWEKHQNTWGQIVSLVVLSNATWILFPLLGMWASAKLILAESEAQAWAVFQ